MTTSPERATSDRHVPVLRDRVLELLAPALAAEGAVYVDGTLGMGGHAEGVLQAFPHARLIGIDRDPQALALAGQRLAPFADRITLVHAVYDEFAQVVDALGIPTVDAALFDLGVSSLHLDETKAAAKNFKVFYAKVPVKTEGSYTMDHTAGSYVLDAAGRVRLFTRYGVGPEALAADLKILLAEPAA